MIRGIMNSRKKGSIMSEQTIAEVEVEAVEKTVADYFVEEDYSPYGVSVVVNEVLADLEVGKELPSQMFYTYAKKGYLDGTKRESLKGVRIAASDAITWTEKYLKKNAS
jgi:hypothetical protein